MMFIPHDPSMRFDVAGVEKLFFVREDLSDLDESERHQLIEKLNALGLNDMRYDNVLILLIVLHEARMIDEIRFLNEVFLPWLSLRNRTRPHLDRVARELSRISEFEVDSVEEASHLVNVYRSIVSDLFDPYMTLVVACFQFKEGCFVNISSADLTNSERAKSEYLNKRVQALFSGRTFLSGYDPLVRNAISHSGSSGVRYHSDRIVFKNIKRGSTPTVQTVEWSFEELQLRVLELMECVLSIEAAVEVFGLDCSFTIASDFPSLLNAAFHALPHHQLKERSEQSEQFLTSLRETDCRSAKEKHELLSRILFVNCGIRQMPCHGARFSEEKSAIRVDVPKAKVDTSDDTHLCERLAEMIRYGILARSVFGNIYSTICIAETDENGDCNGIFGQIKGSDLKEWIEESAGLYDLLNDSEWSFQGRKIDVTVDFERLRSLEDASPDIPFPRRRNRGPQSSQ